MHLSTLLKRNLFILAALLMTLSLHSTQPSVPLSRLEVPVTPSPGVHMGKKKTSFFSFKKVKQLAKSYVLLIKNTRKKYQNDVMLSTILIALLLILGVGAVVYLLSYLGVSGGIVSILSVIGFAVVIWWAIRRIRWNAEY